MGRVLAILYGVVAYVVFLVSFLYAVGFVANRFVPKGIDSGVAGAWIEALVVNCLLLGLFAVQHSVMARHGFKKAWTRVVPPVVERSTFVLFASAILLLMYWQWRPMPTVIWNVENRIGAQVLLALSAIGWMVVFTATLLINHFELFGLKQVFAGPAGHDAYAFKTPGMYKYVRHPIYLGFVIAFWATPTMTAGHLLFAIMTTGYILVGIWFEERDLIRAFGDQYLNYKKNVSMLIPMPPKSDRKADAATRSS